MSLNTARNVEQGWWTMMYDELIAELRQHHCDAKEDDTQEVCEECAYDVIIADESVPSGIASVCVCGLMNRAADAIEELSNIQIAPEKIIQTMWIPVTERLPNCNGCYLVWRPHFFGGEIGMPSICYFDGTNTWHDSYGVDFTRILHPEDVTHWMPLPEPPEEET